MHERSRLQSGVVPYRRVHDSIEVMLITARRSNKWLVPKGNIDSTLTPICSAAREAWEEAGVLGRVQDQVIGSYRYVKSGVPRIVRLYPMLVEEQWPQWPEMNERRRLWLPLEQATVQVFSVGLSAALTRMQALVERSQAAA